MPTVVSSNAGIASGLLATYTHQPVAPLPERVPAAKFPLTWGELTRIPKRWSLRAIHHS
ncbi:hypothetical protein C8T65DRAFT_632930 [Cerioporus squamosus]|nr:hypothetical protein C8T65DRAFT_632930 [Cerioporus squamosus]